jgi:hypothetical protein
MPLDFGNLILGAVFVAVVLLGVYGFMGRHAVR